MERQLADDNTRDDSQRCGRSPEHPKGAPVDVLVTDFEMPHMNGLQLLDVVGDDFPDITRIMVSGVLDDIGTRDALAKGLFNGSSCRRPCLNSRASSNAWFDVDAPPKSIYVEAGRLAQGE